MFSRLFQFLVVASAILASSAVTIKYGHGSHECLSAQTDKANLKPCDGTGWQDWTMKEDGKVQLIQTPEYCLGVVSTSKSGVNLSKVNCNEDRAQHWERHNGNNLKVKDKNLCMDLTDGNESNYVQLSDCVTGKDSEEWFLNDF